MVRRVRGRQRRNGMSAIAPPRPTTHHKRSRNHHAQPQSTWLGSYTDENDHRREVISTAAAAGSTLVIDRDNPHTPG
jgi:hypothetical protein